MGSEGPLPVRVHVSGFRKFHGVPNNPTDTIVSNLTEYMKRRGLPLPGGIAIASCNVIEAAAEAALPLLDQIAGRPLIPRRPSRTRIPRPPTKSFGMRSIYDQFIKLFQLHFGANGGASKFIIECQAVNEATFRCPDERGWQPQLTVFYRFTCHQQLPIVPEDGGISHTRQSTCSIETIAKYLKNRGFEVAISDDADQFVCNYLYYHSLRLASLKGYKSLFVHVPLFSRIDEDTQMEFAASLLEALTLTRLCNEPQRLSFIGCRGFCSERWEQRAHDYVYVKNRMINDLMKSSCLDSALQVFEEMPHRDCVTYNLVISGYAHNGHPRKAFSMLKEMVGEGIRESSWTFSSVVGFCGDARFHLEGLQVHCRAVFLGFISNMFVGSAVTDFYMQIRYPDVALQLFDEMAERDLGTWNLVLRGFCELGYSQELLHFFSEMRLAGIEANALTFCYVIRGCGEGLFLDQGKQLHCYVVKLSWGLSNLFVANALVDFYSSCGDLCGANRAIELIPAEEVISWNSIIAAYAEKGFSVEALDFFAKMQLWDKKPSIRSFVCFLNQSSDSQNLQLGQLIHCFVLKLGLDRASVHVQSALIDMYGKCGEIECSVTMFEDIPERTLSEGIGLDNVSFSTTLKALSLSASASPSNCGLVHCSVVKSGVFNMITEPNLICFTSMIGGYAHNGMGKEGLEVLDLMYQSGIAPDDVTFLSVLTGCSHSGLVKEGLMLFQLMKTRHGISPDRRHYSCVVDLLGRAGLLEEAEKLIKQAPVKGDPLMWTSILRSCRVWRNIEVGRRAVDALMEFKPDDPTAYLQASGFYHEIGDFVSSAKIRKIKAIMDIKREFEGIASANAQVIELAAYGVAEDGVDDEKFMLGDLEEIFNIEDDIEGDFLGIPGWSSERGAKVLVNVDTFGAVGDGTTDDTKAFLSAWDKACSETKSVFLVPEGRRYLVKPTKFKGPCASKLIVQIDGTIVAPDEPNDWDPENPRIWLEFSKLKGISFRGEGIIDGSGDKWWESSCKRNKSNSCREAPSALTIESSSAVNVKGITIQNSMQIHFVISKCDSVRVTNVKVSAPGNSPNTDGIHITKSTNVALLNCKIGTGDDCISIVNGSSRIKMKNIYCGPGHGISIGSLGKDNSTGIVSAVTLDKAFITETTNGLRIKTWQGGSGYVRGVRYQDVQMENVENPIIIDQNYCDSPKSCEKQASAVNITGIMYNNISGTSKSTRAMNFDCSDTVPCSNIVLKNINLLGKDGKVETYCNSATGFGIGFVNPSADCLTSSNKDKLVDQIKGVDLEESSNGTDLTCNARRGGHWRRSRGGESVSLFKKGKNHHHSNGNSPSPVQGKDSSVQDQNKPLVRETSMVAFEAAWAAACPVEASTIIVPSEHVFLVGPISFSGPDCQSNILDGKIIAPTSSKYWGSGLLQWLEFTKLRGITVKGGGVIDGQGSVWWSDSSFDGPVDDEADLLVPVANNSMDDNKNTPPVNDELNQRMPSTKPTALRFYGSYNVIVTGITIQNSPQCHLKFDNCIGVQVFNMSISSPGDSINTDGIHLQNSKDVLIHSTNLACGDDCVSIQTGCSNIFIHNVNCGPGHGISIGGLGRDNTKACVSNVTVRDVVMRNTMNGVRIKTWQGGSGSVQNVMFSNIQVSEVEFPIVIDQFYCDRGTCKNQTSAVALMGVNYERIRGTYTVKPVHFACSDSLPCMDVTLTSIELKPLQERYRLSDPFCWQTFGELATPTVPPINCLQLGKPPNNRILSDYESC
ncbi:hypothetical protein Syun_024113 [Stephania yunnanensis]|uniref:endo-polygalacturonase n=1 Tax=Stephania yunnanensis TaxID=152371 RepID=A0AAP0I2Q5_9MAGN